MILSSDELQIVEYLKSWKGTSVSLMEVCRCAAGRKKFREEPHWARHLMTRLVDLNLIEVNDRGHFRFIFEVEEKSPEGKPGSIPSCGVVDGQSGNGCASQIVGEDYFPTPSEPEEKPERWISPQFKAILHRASKLPGEPQAGL